MPATMPWAAGTMSAKERPRKISPKTNFSATEGWRVPSATQSHAKIGASTITNSALTDWNHDEGKGRPRSSVRVSSSANSVRVVPACSKTAQNRTAAMKKTPMAAMRLLSSSLRKTPK